MRGEQHQGPAIDRLGDLPNDARDLIEERDVTEILEVGRQAEQSLRQVVEG